MVDSQGSQKKNRPTPKRKDAQAATKVAALAPAVTKADKARQKSAAKANRIASRAAYLRGDESALPFRDKGPVKKFVRNYVDRRRSVGEYFLPIIFGVLIFSAIPSKIFQYGSIFIMYGVLLVSVVDGFFLTRKIKVEVAKRFPDEPTKGLGMYAWLRSTQMRRMRAPKPQIKAGENF